MKFVIRLSAIGDVLIATEQVTSLLQSHPDVVFVTSPNTTVIAESITALRYLATFDNGTLRFFERTIDPAPTTPASLPFKPISGSELLQKMDSNVCHQIFDCQATGRSRKCIRSLKKSLKGSALEVTAVQKRSWFRWWLIVIARFRTQQPRKPAVSLSDIVTIADLQKQMLQDYLSPTEQNPIAAAKKQSESEILLPPSRRLIVLCPGASGSLKQWPKEHFRTLRRLILQHTDAHIAVLGSKDDLEISNEIDHPASDRCQNLAGRLSLTESLEVLRQASHIVTGDSFAAHFASRHDIECSVIFGATTPEFGFISKHPKTRVYWLGLGCSPCSRHGQGDCRFQNLKCLRDVTPEMVFAGLHHS